MGLAPRQPDGGVRPETGEVELAEIWPGDDGGSVVAYFDPEALRTTRNKLQTLADEALSGQVAGTPAVIESRLTAAANGHPGSPVGQPALSAVFRNTANCHEEVVQEFGRRYQNLLAALGQIASGMDGTARNLDEGEDATHASVLRAEQVLDSGDTPAPSVSPRSVPPTGGPPAGRPPVDDVAPGGSFDTGGA